MNVSGRPVEALATREIGKTGYCAESQRRGHEQDEKRAPLDPAESPPERSAASRSGRLRHGRTLAGFPDRGGAGKAPAAGVGFEPTGALSGASGFQDRSI